MTLLRSPHHLKLKAQAVKVKASSTKAQFGTFKVMTNPDRQTCGLLLRFTMARLYAQRPLIAGERASNSRAS